MPDCICYRTHLSGSSICRRLNCILAQPENARSCFLLEKQGTGNNLSPGESGLVQFIIDGDIACCSGDRFLLRDDSESVTLGGGIVLDAHAPRKAKASFSRLTYLAAMEMGTVGETLWTLLIDHLQIVNLSRFKAILECA